MVRVICLTACVRNEFGMFSGQKGGGKTTFANLLIKHGVNVHDVPQATALKSTVRKNMEVAPGKQKTDTVIEWNGKKYTLRQVLEKEGSAYKNVDKMVWVNLTQQRIDEHYEKWKKEFCGPVDNFDALVAGFKKSDLPVPEPVYVVSDVRLPEEFKYWAEQGAIMVCIERTIHGAEPFDEKTDHESNSWPFEKTRWDLTVDNTKSLAKLEEQAIKLLDNYDFIIKKG